MTNYADMTVAEWSKLPGIDGLPTAVTWKFLQALRAEEKGEHEQAARLLDEAVETEPELLTKSHK